MSMIVLSIALISACHSQILPLVLMHEEVEEFNRAFYSFLLKYLIESICIHLNMPHHFSVISLRCCHCVSKRLIDFNSQLMISVSMMVNHKLGLKL
ncbi:CLUMA_CG013915, isoform A [Clunio marinus]|uniref:CLUMA_CG013915, isoform A n=1 Tax=Clunio marinus TaxID=568069 RepID=A0A1J1IK90_9DIPT|nr:CLUMA_CG013915, isoform A [Clunio marinus]